MKKADTSDKAICHLSFVTMSFVICHNVKNDNLHFICFSSLLLKQKYNAN